MPGVAMARSGMMSCNGVHSGILQLNNASVQRRLSCLPVRHCPQNRGKHAKIGITSQQCSRIVSTMSTTAGGRTIEELNNGIAGFYDESSGLWEDIWGEHMHHGHYYYPKGTNPSTKTHRQAQLDMIDATLDFAGMPSDGASPAAPKRILDVGCGIGGGARFLARRYPGAQVDAITLSPIQRNRATQLTAQQGLDDRVQFHVADALNQPFPDASFDFVYSMESGEHMPDKRKFLGELARVTMPGGRIVIVTWCHRDLKPGETALAWNEKDIRVEDWTDYVQDFWPAVVQSALTPQGFMGLLKTGWTTTLGAMTMSLMILGYWQGTIKFPIITARKKAA
eukprot:jgi/Mesvir1/8519/Mv09813-RA.2